MRWNIADLYDIAEKQIAPEKTAIIEAFSGREVLWGDLSIRSNNLAKALQGMASEPGEKVAIYMRNCAEYIETVIACEKARLVPVNVNFRYLEDELRYILDNSDATIVVYEQDFAANLQPLLSQLPSLKHTIEVNHQGQPSLSTSTLYSSLASTGNGQALDIKRSPDDLFFVYTGGTTGLPKAVMWPHDTLFRMIGINAFSPAPVFPENYDGYAEQLQLAEGARTLIPVPLMHGAGIHIAQTTLLYGGCVILSSNRGYDAEQLLTVIDDTQAENMVIVGDAFAKPLLDALNAHPGRWQLTSLRSMLSSAMTFSVKTKKALLEHIPEMIIVDTLGASETPSIALSISNKNAIAAEEMEMPVNAETKVFTDAFEEVQAGSEQSGMLARSGHIPIGYYKDPEKTAKAFPEINGVRYAVPGDYAKVLPDGMIKLLGRGNVSINSGGEKIFPDEVECAIKQHSSVQDIVVVGVPDERWGQAVCAVVQFKAGAKASDDDIQSFAREQIAAYKIPRTIVPIESVNRGPNGKADYVRLRNYALDQLGLVQE